MRKILPKRNGGNRPERAFPGKGGRRGKQTRLEGRLKNLQKVGEDLEKQRRGKEKNLVKVPEKIGRGLRGAPETNEDGAKEPAGRWDDRTARDIFGGRNYSP